MEFFCVEVIFAMLPSSRKFPPHENKTYVTLLRKHEKYRENYPHVIGLTNIFAKVFPSKNNHIYSNGQVCQQVRCWAFGEQAIVAFGMCFGVFL